ncbi:MAG: hypothetical protein K5644_08215 [Lachnospiraceae bacterium]|nr:hypothetical protein [Lachnospiraceae bacterium]
MKKNLWKSFITPVAFIAVVVAIIFWATSLGNKASTEQADVLEEAIRKASVSCYAIEGRYPESLKYIKDNYGVFINEEDFTINYEVFASNIMPSIEVKIKGE